MTTIEFTPVYDTPAPGDGCLSMAWVDATIGVSIASPPSISLVQIPSTSLLHHHTQPNQLTVQKSPSNSLPPFRRVSSFPANDPSACEPLIGALPHSCELLVSTSEGNISFINARSALPSSRPLMTLPSAATGIPVCNSKFLFTMTIAGFLHAATLRNLKPIALPPAVSASNISVSRICPVGDQGFLLSVASTSSGGDESLVALVSTPLEHSIRRLLLAQDVPKALELLSSSLEVSDNQREFLTRRVYVLGGWSQIAAGEVHEGLKLLMHVDFVDLTYLLSLWRDYLPKAFMDKYIPVIDKQNGPDLMEVNPWESNSSASSNFFQHAADSSVIAAPSLPQKGGQTLDEDRHLLPVFKGLTLSDLIRSTILDASKKKREQPPTASALDVLVSAMSERANFTLIDFLFKQRASLMMLHRKEAQKKAAELKRKTRMMMPTLAGNYSENLEESELLNHAEKTLPSAAFSHPTLLEIQQVVDTILLKLCITLNDVRWRQLFICSPSTVDSSSSASFYAPPVSNADHRSARFSPYLGFFDESLFPPSSTPPEVRIVLSRALGDPSGTLSLSLTELKKLPANSASSLGASKSLVAGSSGSSESVGAFLIAEMCMALAQLNGDVISRALLEGTDEGNEKALLEARANVRTYIIQYMPTMLKHSVLTGISTSSVITTLVDVLLSGCISFSESLELVRDVAFSSANDQSSQVNASANDVGGVLEINLLRKLFDNMTLENNPLHLNLKSSEDKKGKSDLESPEKLFMLLTTLCLRRITSSLISAVSESNNQEILDLHSSILTGWEVESIRVGLLASGLAMQSHSHAPGVSSETFSSVKEYPSVVQAQRYLSHDANLKHVSTRLATCPPFTFSLAPESSMTTTLEECELSLRRCLFLCLDEHRRALPSDVLLSDGFFALYAITDETRIQKFDLKSKLALLASHPLLPLWAMSVWMLNPFEMKSISPRMLDCMTLLSSMPLDVIALTLQLSCPVRSLLQHFQIPVNPPFSLFTMPASFCPVSANSPFTDLLVLNRLFDDIVTAGSSTLGIESAEFTAFNTSSHHNLALGSRHSQKQSMSISDFFSLDAPSQSSLTNVREPDLAANAKVVSSASLANFTAKCVLNLTPPKGGPTPLIVLLALLSDLWTYLPASLPTTDCNYIRQSLTESISHLVTLFMGQLDLLPTLDVLDVLPDAFPASVLANFFSHRLRVSKCESTIAHCHSLLSAVIYLRTFKETAEIKKQFAVVGSDKACAACGKRVLNSPFLILPNDLSKVVHLECATTHLGVKGTGTFRQPLSLD